MRIETIPTSWSTGEHIGEEERLVGLVAFLFVWKLVATGIDKNIIDKRRG